MPEIAYCLPSTVLPLADAEFGWTRPGLQQNRFETGRYLARDLFGFNLKEYEFDITPLDGAGDDSVWTLDALAEFERFLQCTNGGAEPFWIMEPVNREHWRIIAGPPLDGTATTFALPLYDVENEGLIDVGGVLRGAASASWEPANLLPNDDQACASALTEWIVSYGSESLQWQSPLTATWSLQAIPDGTSSGQYTRALSGSDSVMASNAPVVAGRVYTGLVWVQSRANYEFDARIYWYQSNGTFISQTTGTTTDCPYAQWQALEVSGTAPALAAYARVGVVRTEVDATNVSPFYVGAAAITPGTYDRWHLPTRCPTVLVFPSAYSWTGHGRVIVERCLGQRITRCVGDPGMRLRFDSYGNARPQRIRATEILEF